MRIKHDTRQPPHIVEAELGVPGNESWSMVNIKGEGEVPQRVRDAIAAGAVPLEYTGDGPLITIIDGEPALADQAALKEDQERRAAVRAENIARHNAALERQKRQQRS